MNRLIRSTILFSLLQLCTVSRTSAQILKNNWLVGGNAAFYSYKNDKTKMSDLTISANAGYFFIDKLAGGVQFGYDMHSQKNTVRISTTLMRIAPFLRYYVLSPDQQFNVLIDAGYGYAWDRTRWKSPLNETYKKRTQIFFAKAGPTLFLNKHTSFEFTIGYQHALPIYRNVDTVAVSSFRVGVGFQIHL